MKTKFFTQLFFVVLVSAYLYATDDPRMTRQIVIDIDTTLTTCCAETDANFIGTFTDIAFLDALLHRCLPQKITQASIGTSGYTISTSGVYALTENIIFNPLVSAAAITINADNVILDLRCFGIQQGTLTANVDGIAVSANSSNVVIKNGSLKNFTGAGIRVASGCSNLAYTDISIQNCLYGILSEGTTLSPIEIMNATGLDLLSNSTSVSYTNVQRSLIQNCSILNSQYAGIEFISSFSNTISRCSIENIAAASGSTCGISLLAGGNNRVEYCLIDGISTTDTFSGNSAVGILIGATENNDVIINNQISNCMTTSNAQPFGIEMQYTFTFVSNFGLPGESIMDFSTEWSSSGRYLLGAAATGTGGVVIEEFVSNTTLINVVPLSGINYRTAEWSPDDSLVFAQRLTPSSIVEVFSFDGAGLKLNASLTFPIFFGNQSSSNWSPNGIYIAAGNNGSPGSVNNLAILKFTNNSLQLISLGSLIYAVQAVEWSPDGQYLAVCGLSGIVTTQLVIVYKLVNNALVQVASFTETSGSIGTLAWSPDGQFLATGSTVMRIFKFTGSALTQVAVSTVVPALVSITWSPDGKYLANAGPSSTLVNYYSFDGQSTLTALFSYNQGNTLNRVRWDVNGAFVFQLTLANASSIVSGLRFPAGSFIQGNQIFNIRGPALPAGQPGASSGRGISASSANNLILQNTVFDTDMAYVFANNTFQQFIANSAQEPNLLSNLLFPPL